MKATILYKALGLLIEDDALGEDIFAVGYDTIYVGSPARASEGLRSKLEALGLYSNTITDCFEIET